MYKYEEIERIMLIFNNYIKSELVEKEKELLKISTELENIKFIEEFNRFFSIEFILNNKDKIIKLIPELSNDINIIEFFYNNNATNIEQVEICLNNIKNNELFIKNNNINELISKKDKLEKLINIYNYILNDEKYISDDFIEVIESSPFNEKEKLLIYANMAHESIKKENIVDETKENAEEIINTKETIKEEEINYDVCKDEYNSIKEKIQKYINQYYELIKGKDKRYINYIKSYVNLSKSTEKDYIYDYPEEKLLIKIFELIEVKEEIEQDLNILNINSTTQELENLHINIEIAKEELETIEIYSQKYEELKKIEKENKNPNKLYYLTDENNELFFDIKDFEYEQKQKIPALLEKLNRGMYDYQKGIKHTKVQTNYKENPVFVNKNSDMAISYIRIDEEKILILNIDLAKNIYDSVNPILYNRANLIRITKNKIINSDKEEMDKQRKINSELNNKINNGGNLKL